MFLGRTKVVRNITSINITKVYRTCRDMKKNKNTQLSKGFCNFGYGYME